MRVTITITHLPSDDANTIAVALKEIVTDLTERGYDDGEFAIVYSTDARSKTPSIRYRVERS